MEHNSINPRHFFKKKKKRVTEKEECLVLKEEKDKDGERQLVFPEIKLGYIF